MKWGPPCRTVDLGAAVKRPDLWRGRDEYQAMPLLTSSCLFHFFLFLSGSSPPPTRPISWIDKIDRGNLDLIHSSSQASMPRRHKAKKLSYGCRRESPYALKPLPEGVPVPMCWCGDPCKTPPPLCEFEQWIDTEIKKSDKEHLEGLKKWDEERRQRYEMRLKQEAAEKEHKEEEARRKAAATREERERKFERVRRAKAAMEENPDAQKKGKWPRCTQ